AITATTAMHALTLLRLNRNMVLPPRFGERRVLVWEHMAAGIAVQLDHALAATCSAARTRGSRTSGHARPSAAERDALTTSCFSVAYGQHTFADCAGSPLAGPCPTPPLGPALAEHLPGRRSRRPLATPRLGASPKLAADRAPLLQQRVIDGALEP